MKTTIQITKDYSGQRIDRLLLKYYKDLPRNLLYKLFRKKDIKINKKTTHAEYMLQNGDILDIHHNGDLESKLKAPQIIAPVEPVAIESKVETEKSLSSHPSSSKLEILYEDQHIIVVNKPRGISVQKSTSKSRCMNNIIQRYLRDHQTAVYNPSFLHRLDRDTSGCLLGAKTAAAARQYSEYIREHQIQKSYVALVDNRRQILDHTMGKKWREINGYITPNGKFSVFSFRSTSPESQESRMEYKVINSTDTRARLIIKLHTGRKHQIRATLKFIGCPIVGDRWYNGPRESHLHLHASSLMMPSMRRPGEEIAVKGICPF